MIKHLHFTKVALTITTGILLFASCESNVPAGESAFEEIKTDRMMTGDSATVVPLEEKKIVKPIEVQRKEKKEILDEWTQFKIDMDERMTANENKIQEIKTIPNLSSDAFSKVTTLEKENHSLRLDLADYVEVDIDKHRKFKQKFSEQLMDIKISLEEISMKATVDGLLMSE